MNQHIGNEHSRDQWVGPVIWSPPKAREEPSPPRGDPASKWPTFDLSDTSKWAKYPSIMRADPETWPICWRGVWQGGLR